MKKLLLLSVLCLTFHMTSGQTSAVKANPIGLAFGIANAGYEFTTSDSNSVTVSGLYFNISDITGVGAGAEYRWYFDKEAITGWHAGPTVSFFSLEDVFDTSATVFSFGGQVGHQWVFDSGFLVDVFGGLAYAAGGDDLSGFNTAAISLGVSIGYAW
jgi:hypothetical protein